MKYFYIDDMDIAQELTEDQLRKLVSKYGLDVFKNIYLESSDGRGIIYRSVEEVLQKEEETA